MMRFMQAMTSLLIVVVSLVAAAEFPRWDRASAPATPTIGMVMGGSDPSILLAVRGGRGAERSADGGATWTPFTLDGRRPDRVFPSPTDPRVFYAAAGGVSSWQLTGPQPSALYRSSDAGATWARLFERFVAEDGAMLGNLSVGAHPDLVYALRMVEASCMIGCVYDGTGAYVSTDGGRSWRNIDQGFLLKELFPSASDPAVVYGWSYRGIYRSSDQGGTWTLVRSLAQGTFIRQMVVDRKDPSSLYVRPDDGTGLWVTEDGGSTWRVSAAIDVPGPTKRLAADPARAGHLYFMGHEGEIFRTQDRARSWQRVAPSSGGSVVHLPHEYRNAYPAVGASGERRVVMGYHADGSIARLEFGDDAWVLGSDHWWNPAESGWGLSLTQHESGQLFAVWYTYGEGGEPTWYVLPGGAWDAPRSFSAGIYRTRGPAYFAGPFDASRVTVTRVGTATLRFTDDSHATFAYRFDDGVAGETSVTRQLFGTPNDWNIADGSDLWWNAAESGWGLAVSQQFGRVFATWFVYDDQGRPTWLVLPDTGYGYDFEGPYQGYARLSGELYATRGDPPGRPFDPARVGVRAAGSASVTFVGRDRVALRYSTGGHTGVRELARQPF